MFGGLHTIGVYCSVQRCVRWYTSYGGVLCVAALDFKKERINQKLTQTKIVGCT